LPVKINGKKIKDFDSFVKDIQSKKDGFIVLEDKAKRQVVIDVKEALERNRYILNLYNIEFDRSKDLRK